MKGTDFSLPGAAYCILAACATPVFAQFGDEPQKKLPPLL
jgi:hypothetical protein